MIFCNICGAENFKNAESLHAHKWRHTRKRDLRCTYCRRSFATLTGRSRHELTHQQPTQGKPQINDAAPATTNSVGRLVDRENFTIRKIRYMKSRKLETSVADYAINFKGFDAMNPTEVYIRFSETMREIIKIITAGFEQRDYVRLVIQSPTLTHPISIPYIVLDSLSVEIILHQIEKVLQSYEALELDALEMNVLRTEFPLKGGRAANAQTRGYGKFTGTFDDWCSKRKCIIRIKNTDNLCLARAIVVGMVFATTKSQNERKAIQREKQQLFRAKELHRLAGVSLEDDEYGISAVALFQSYLKPDFQLCVYESLADCRRVFKGPSGKNVINLMLHRKHYCVIQSMNAFFDSYYCGECDRAFSSKHHQCSRGCSLCKSATCDGIDLLEEKKYTTCIYCDKVFGSDNCFNDHISSGICKKQAKCLKCCKIVKRAKLHPPSAHNCGKIMCSICYDLYPPDSDHKCYIKPFSLPENSLTVKYFFFDIEARFDEGIHEACLLVVKDERDATTIYRGDNCVDNFMNNVLELSRNNTKERHIYMAHNLKGYDSYFLLNYCYRKSIWPKVIFQGSKLLSMSFSKRLKFSDSCAFMPMPLASLPKCFGLSNISKGYFPLLFNTKENENYVGPLPDEKYFMAKETMKPNDYTEFKIWYKSAVIEHRNNDFNLRYAMEKYCILDTDILRRSVLEFIRLCVETSGVDICAYSSTIAGGCNLIFRKNFLKPNTIARLGSLPQTGRPYSLKSRQWLAFKSAELGYNIQSATNGGEYCIKGIVNGNRVSRYPDGFCAELNTVFLFHGCYYHACEHMYDSTQIHTQFNKPAWKIRNETEEVERWYKEQGLTCVTMKECDFDVMAQTNVKLQDFLKSRRFLPPLSYRDCLFGGRVELGSMFYKAKPGEQIKYVDFQSMYPAVNKHEWYPVGHPIISHNPNNVDLESMEAWFGMAKVDILPPRKLLFGVLPVRTNEQKLIFPLCHACGVVLTNQLCEHKDADRLLTGSWCTFEIAYAMRRGYKLIAIHEVHHWPTKSNDLFKSFINTFLKSKITSSGYPAYCVTNTDKRKYIDGWNEHENISISPEEIEKNPGKRTIAKLILNSFWGKLGERCSEVSKTEFLTRYDELATILTDPKYSVNDGNLVGEDGILLSYKLKSDMEVPGGHNNVPIACMTTAWARLKLLREMENVGERLLYTDTDAIIYISRPQCSDLIEGDYLGELANELKDFPVGSVITEFWCLSAKNYGYTVVSPNGDKESVFKCKGIKLTVQNCSVVNPKEMKRLIFEDPDDTLTAFGSSIARNKYTANLHTINQQKRYKIVFDKKILFADYSTKPIGYSKT